MRVRRVDAQGDFVFGSNQAAFYRDQPEAVAQVVESRLHLWKGDWYLDLAEGTPYQTQILGKFTDKTRDVVMRARMLASPGVTGLKQYSSTFDGGARSFAISAELVTAYTSLAPTGRVSATANLNTTVYKAR